MISAIKSNSDLDDNWVLNNDDNNIFEKPYLYLNLISCNYEDLLKKFFNGENDFVIDELKLVFFIRGAYDLLENFPLSKREIEALKMQFGLIDGYVKTLGETAYMFKVSRERIRQIENKACRRLKSKGILPLKYLPSEIIDNFISYRDDKKVLNRQ